MKSRSLWNVAGLIVVLMLASEPAGAEITASDLCQGSTRRPHAECSQPAPGASAQRAENLPVAMLTRTAVGSASSAMLTRTAVGSASSRSGSRVASALAVAPRVRSGVGAMVFTDRANPANTYRDIATLKAAGATWIRLDIPKGAAGSVRDGRWRPDPAAMNFYDQAAERAAAAGLHIALVMADFDNERSWTDAQHRAYLGQYTEHVASRLGDDVDLWQIYNEHDQRDYRTFAPVAPTPQYLQRFRLTLQAARAGLRKHSTAPMTTTPFGYPIDDKRYQKWITFYDAVGSSVDVIGIHAYPEKSTTTIAKVPKYIRQLKARYRKPVAVLEFGLPGIRDYGSSAEIGKTLVAQINAVMSAGPMCATLYQLRDRGPSGSADGEQVFGIIRKDFTRKPYFTTVTTSIRRWNR